MKIITLLFCILLSFSATAQESQQPISKNLAQHVTDIQKIEKYLNDINTLVAPFEQHDSSGGKATGTFYLQRPGRLRWDYAPPTPILIVAKGTLVAYYDKELDEVSHVSIDDTLAGFLTRQKISFSDDGAKVISFTKKNGEISISITQDKKEDQGTLTMVFSDDGNIDLVSMEVTDSIGKKTVINFTSLTYNKPLEKELFFMPRVKAKLR